MFTQQVGITGSFTKRRAGHSFCPTLPSQLPSWHCPDGCSSSAPGAKCFFPPSLTCAESFSRSLHPRGPTGWCARLIPSAAAQEIVSHRSAPGQGCLLLPTAFTPRAGSALPVTFKGTARGQPRHPKSSCPWCLLLPAPWDKAFCSNAAAYKDSCLLKATFLGLGMPSNGKRPFSTFVRFSSTLKPKERPAHFKGWLHSPDERGDLMESCSHISHVCSR